MNSMDELFKTWRAEGGVRKPFSVFVEDGIVDENQYCGRKILFILKDLHLDEKNRAQYEQQGYIDMRTHVCDKEDWRTWNPIAMWSKALLEDNIKSYADASPELADKQAIRDAYLSRIAFMNLKKEAGYAYASDDCILHYAEEDARFIRQQIKLIDPDLIIACGAVVFDAIRTHIFNTQDSNYFLKNHLNAKMYDYGDTFDIAAEIGKEKPLYIVKYRHPVDFGRGACTAEEHFENMITIREYVFKS